MHHSCTNYAYLINNYVERAFSVGVPYACKSFLGSTVAQ